MDPRVEALLKIERPDLRRVRFVALLSDEMRRRGHLGPVVVGGHAVEIFTRGNYSTKDIDVLTPHSEVLGDICRSWGLEKRGRHWVRKDLEVAIELGANEYPERIGSLVVEGSVVRVISIEDLIIDRLCAYVWWRSTQDGDWAEMLLDVQRKQIDFEYLRRRAGEEDVVPALDEVLARKAKG